MASTHTSGRIGLVVVAVFLSASLLGGTVANVAGTPIADHGSGTDAANVPAAIDTAAPQVGDDRNRLVIDSTGNERVFYEVTVSGSIELGEEANPVEAEVPDSVSENTATGSVLGGTDDYFFTGEITAIEARGGSADVYVNGERIDPDDVEDTTTTGTTTPTLTSATSTATETETDTETTTATGTRTQVTSPTSSPATTTGSGANEGATGLSEQERGLFLTIGAVLLLGIVAIGGFALLVRR